MYALTAPTPLLIRCMGLGSRLMVPSTPRAQHPIHVLFSYAFSTFPSVSSLLTAVALRVPSIPTWVLLLVSHASLASSYTHERSSHARSSVRPRFLAALLSSPMTRRILALPLLIARRLPARYAHCAGTGGRGGYSLRFIAPMPVYAGPVPVPLVH